MLCVILVLCFSRRMKCVGVPFARALTPKLKLRLSTVFPTVAGGTIRPYRRAIRATRCVSFPLDPCRAPSLTARGSCPDFEVLRTGWLFRPFPLEKPGQHPGHGVPELTTPVVSQSSQLRALLTLPTSCSKSGQLPLVLRLNVEPLEVRRGTALLWRPFTTPHAQSSTWWACGASVKGLVVGRGESTPLWTPLRHAFVLASPPACNRAGPLASNWACLVPSRIALRGFFARTSRAFETAVTAV